MSSTRAAAEREIENYARDNARMGHELAGFLSAERGFIPVAAPLLSLAPRFAAWDQLAAELPALQRRSQLRAQVEQCPLLDASCDALDDRQALRACALLAITAHAYWYADATPPAALPEAIAKPWLQLRERLGRDQAVLSYIDLIVYNWRLRDAAHPELLVEQLDLLFPTVDLPEERIFYLTQLEILARTAPVVTLSAQAQSAALQQDDRALERCLLGISACLREVIARALPKISPERRHASYVDAVVWAKTVAPLAVPFRRVDQGPSGTSSPLFNTLDVFFGRERFHSQLGREIKTLRGGYPPAWRAFIAALEQVSVADYVQRRAQPPLRDAWQEALELYAGERGFLGRHRRKVFGYLELAFKVGRSLTIGGFSGVVSARTWRTVDDALAAARSERFASDPGSEHAPVAASCRASPAAAEDQRVYELTEIAQHNTLERGLWIVLHDGVYDISQFVDAHPGGHHILRAYAGTDATDGFTRAHADTAAIAKLAQNYRIGRVRRSPRAPALAATYASLCRLLQALVEMQNALAADYGFRLERAPPRTPAPRTTPYEWRRALETHRRFVREYLQPLAWQLLPEFLHAAQPVLARADACDGLLAHMQSVVGACLADSLTCAQFESSEDQAQAALARATAEYERLDRGCLDALKALTCQALGSIDADDLEGLHRARRELPLALGEIAATLSGYQQRACGLGAMR